MSQIVIVHGMMGVFLTESVRVSGVEGRVLAVVKKVLSQWRGEQAGSEQSTVEG